VSSPSSAAVILAAGESSRMGKDKALLQYRGRPFLETVILNLREAGVDRIVVVLGHHADEIQTAITFHGAEVVVNETYRLGQTSSLQAGLKALDLAKVSGVLLCLVDHPAVPGSVMRRVIEAHRDSGASVIVPVYRGQRGHPVFIGRALFEELLSLAPDQGANTVVRRYRSSTCWLNIDDSGVLLDVDRPEDYRRLVGEAGAGRQ
jgi:molybdenum cofactor cytidylyltransferase